jgi:3-isopropylmalate dehydrogenase
MLPSASLGDGPSLYEPVHGSAPDLVGQGSANPMGAILSVAMMLEQSFNRGELARSVEAAVMATLREVRTPDLGGRNTTAEVTAAVRRNLEWMRWSHASPEDEASYEWGV